MLRILTWLLRLFLFLVLLAFAVKNTMPVRLNFFFGAGWEVPMVVLLLVFFAAGAVLGVMACLGGLIRQRRRIGSLEREIDALAPPQRPAAASLAPLPPDPGI